MNVRIGVISDLVSYELTRDNKCEESDGRSGGGMQ